MSDLDDQTDDIDEGAPAWMTTFADLMSLLMCFFVLLLSFSEMDVNKYKQVAGSMKFAFGVQRRVEVKDIPKGTSIIAQEFSPGKPQPTLIKVLQQQTIDDTKDTVDFRDAAARAKERANEIAEHLSEEIEEGLVEVETSGEEVVIRIREKGSFPSGSAMLNDSFHPVLDTIGDLLSSDEDRVVVSGHTDDRPISTPEYPSNWVLSAVRASSVVHYLMGYKMLAPQRLEIRAHADTLPMASNDTPENRARNRRVEIVITHARNQATKVADNQTTVEMM